MLHLLAGRVDERQVVEVVGQLEADGALQVLDSLAVPAGIDERQYVDEVVLALMFVNTNLLEHIDRGPELSRLPAAG